MAIASSDIQLRQSGASDLGGAPGASAPSGFATVTPAEAVAGSTKYRCFYVRNNHGTLTLSAAKFWLSANTPSDSTDIAVGLGSSAAGATEQTIANETIAPANVTFSATGSEATALLLGDLGPGVTRAVWERRTVNAGASAVASDAYERTVSGVSPDDAATVQSLWTGVPKTDGAVISAKLNSTNTANSSRVAVSLASNLSSPVYSSIVAPDPTYRVAKHNLSGLQPNTEYFYGVEVDGTLDSTAVGRFKTLPAAGPANFSIVLGGCATNTDDAAFAAINALNPKPLFLLAMGDFQYMDITAPTTANYHTAFDTSLARTVRKVTHSQIPTVFMWDDHDFQTNDATGRDASNAVRSFRATGLQFFRDRIPAIPASSTATDTAHYSFVVGRVRFVISDMRSDKTLQSATDNSSKTMMGTAQKAWFKAEIAAAKAAGQVVAWMNSVPWVVSATAGADDWGGYTTERAEISNYIKAQAMTGKVFILSADMHALAIHTGADYATGGGGAIPVFHAGPFNRACSTKGGPYTYGPYPASGSTVVAQYGVMDVNDDGTTLTVAWRGYSSNGTIRMSHSFTPIVAAPVATVPAKMDAPTATAGNGQAEVSLSAPSDGGSAITGYTVTSVPAGGVDSAAGTTALNRTITGLQNGTSYQFSATATNDVGPSTASDLSNAVTPAAPAATGFQATGGVITEPGDGYRYWTFTSTANLVVSQAGEVEHLVVAGGAAGSSGNTSAPGGGGAGGVRDSDTEGLLAIPSGTHTVTIGAGGTGIAAGGGTKGSNSSIGSLITAIGGGTSGYSSTAPTTGGSGGGGGNAGGTSTGASGTAGQGNAGGNGVDSSGTQANRSGGGGGGAAGPGSNGVVGTGGSGGPGRTIWGRSVGGGGGAASQGATQGAATHGGGTGSKSGAAGNGAANTGGGGGGAALNQRSGDGGSGIVVIRRPI